MFMLLLKQYLLMLLELLFLNQIASCPVFGEDRQSRDLRSVWFKEWQYWDVQRTLLRVSDRILKMAAAWASIQSPIVDACAPRASDSLKW